LASEKLDTSAIGIIFIFKGYLRKMNLWVLTLDLVPMEINDVERGVV